MARLTWQEVSNPNFASANSAFGMMGDLLKSASQPLSNAIGQMQDARTQRTSNQLMQAALSYQDPAAMQQALSSGSLFTGMDPRYINPAAMDMVQGQRASLLGERQEEARTALTGAQTNQVNQNISHSGVRFNNEQDKLAATREVELVRAQVDELSRNGDVAGAQALLRQNANLFGRAGLDIGTELNTPGSILGNQQEQIRSDRTFLKEIEGYGQQDQAQILANRVIQTSRSPEEAARRLQDLRTEEGISPQAVQGALGLVGSFTGNWGSSEGTLQGALSGLTGGMVPQPQTDNSWATQALGAAASNGQPRNGGQAAMGVLREFEGFQPGAYYDVNAYRTGYGSDTVTRPDGTVVQVDANTRVSREDAERDLERRVTQEFMPRAIRAVGQENWERLSPAQQGALTSITYNYGSLPDSVARAVASGDTRAAAAAIQALASHNDGVNAGRRNREAEIFAGGNLSFGDNVPSSGGIPASGSRVEQMFAAALQDPNAPAPVAAGVDPVQALREVALSPVNVEADTPELSRPQNPPVQQTEQSTEGGDFTTQALATAAADPQQFWDSLMAQVPEVDPNASAAVQAQQANARQEYVNNALRRTRDQYGSMDNVVTRGLGAVADSAAGMWDYFTATPEVGAANAASREAERVQRNQVWDTFNNPALAAEANRNPEVLQQALQDPVSFALARAAQGQPDVAPQAPATQAAPAGAAVPGQAPAPAGTQAAAAQQISAASAQAASAAGVSPDVIQTPEAASPAALNALSNPLSAPPRPLQAANWDQAVSGVRNTMVMDATQNRLVGVDQAVRETQSTENANKSALEAASSFYDKYQSRVNEDKAKWQFKVSREEIARDLKWMQDSLGIPPHVGERILEELPPTTGWVSDGVDRTKVRELWGNYISAREETVAPGVSRLQAMDEQKRRLDMIEQIDQTYKQFSQMGRKEGTSPEMLALNETVMRSVLAVIANSGLGTTPYSDGRFNKPAPQPVPQPASTPN